MMTLPANNRRIWLALQSQKHRRARMRAALPTLLPAPVLRAVYPDLLQWDWDFPDPYKWNVWQSLDGGASYILVDGYWEYGDARQFAPDGGGELHFIVGVDADGNEITGRSNAVRPDDAPVTGLFNGLVAHFGLDEASGNFVDDVGSKVLQVVNGTVSRGSGLQGLAVEMTGDGGSLLSSFDTTAFSPTAEGFTVSFWVDFSSLLDAAELTYMLSVWQDVGWPAGSSWHICSYNPGGGDHAVEILAPGFSVLPFAADLTSGWTHLCLTYDPLDTVWIMYVNGALMANDNFGFSPVAGRLGIGAHTSAEGGLTQGKYDELAFWSRALNPDEVAQLYNDGNGLPYENF